VPKFIVAERGRSTRIAFCKFAGFYRYSILHIGKSLIVMVRGAGFTASFAPDSLMLTPEM
jgi:hypothetical protein